VEPSAVSRRVRREPAGVLLQHVARELRAVDIGGGRGLAGHGLRHLRPAVTHVHDDGTARAVEVALPAAVPEDRPLAPLDGGQLAPRRAAEDERLRSAFHYRTTVLLCSRRNCCT